MKPALNYTIFHAVLQSHANTTHTKQFSELVPYLKTAGFSEKFFADHLHTGMPFLLSQKQNCIFHQFPNIHSTNSTWEFQRKLKFSTRKGLIFHNECGILLYYGFLFFQALKQQRIQRLAIAGIILLSVLIFEGGFAAYELI